MKIVILNEGDSDSRVSASPETVRKIYEMNHSIYVQKGAGVESNFIDQEYEKNGAKIFEDKDTIREADVIFKINKPSIDEIELFKENSILIAALDPFNNPDLIENLNPKFPEDFEVYDPKITDKIFKGGMERSVKTFEYLIIPRTKGKYRIPSGSLIVYNPKTKTHAYYPKTVKDFNKKEADKYSQMLKNVKAAGIPLGSLQGDAKKASADFVKYIKASLATSKPQVGHTKLMCLHFLDQLLKIKPEPRDNFLTDLVFLAAKKGRSVFEFGPFGKLY